ncbi:hypothetical protein T12_1514, partial [Trichinella patagoniensis]
SQVIILQTHNNAYLWIGAETKSQHYVHCEFAYPPLGQIRLTNSHRSECNATGFTSGSIPLRNGQGHLFKVDPVSTETCAMRLSRRGPPFKGRGARGGAGAVELGLTLFPRRQASGTATG